MDYTRIAKGCSGITRTLIDHIWTNIPRIVVTNGLLEIPWSDHDMPWAEITLKRPTIRLETKKARVFQKFSIIELIKECKKETWEWRNTEKDAEPEEVSTRKICECEETRLDCCIKQEYEIKVRRWKERRRVGEINQEILDRRVEELELKMRRVIDKCAPMKTSTKKGK